MFFFGNPNLSTPICFGGNFGSIFVQNPLKTKPWAKAENWSPNARDWNLEAKNWNLEADSTNKGAALAFMVLPMSFRDEDLNYKLDAVIKKLHESIIFLNQKFGTIEVSLGKVFRLVRGDTQYPLSGGPGLLRAIYCNKVDGIYQARAGDCSEQAVEWGPDGELSAWSIHQFGSATLDSTSPHYSDQAELFHKEEMKIIRP